MKNDLLTSSLNFEDLLRGLINKKSESDAIEFKSLYDYSIKDDKLKVWKHMTAIANYWWGYLIIGVWDDWNIDWITQEQYDKYDTTDIWKFNSKYIENTINFSLIKWEIDWKLVVIIQINEFQLFPHVIKKDMQSSKSVMIAQEWAILTRKLWQSIRWNFDEVSKIINKSTKKNKQWIIAELKDYIWPILSDINHKPKETLDWDIEKIEVWKVRDTHSWKFWDNKQRWYFDFSCYPIDYFRKRNITDIEEIMKNSVVRIKREENWLQDTFYPVKEWYHKKAITKEPEWIARYFDWTIRESSYLWRNWLLMYRDELTAYSTIRSAFSQDKPKTLSISEIVEQVALFLSHLRKIYWWAWFWYYWNVEIEIRLEWTKDITLTKSWNSIPFWNLNNDTIKKVRISPSSYTLDLSDQNNESSRRDNIFNISKIIIHEISWNAENYHTEWRINSAINTITKYIDI